MKTEVIKKIKELVVDVAGIPYDRVTLDARLGDLEIDSLDLSQVIIEIEQEFGLDQMRPSFDQFNTIGDFVNYVEDFIKNNLPPSK